MCNVNPLPCYRCSFRRAKSNVAGKKPLTPPPHNESTLVEYQSDDVIKIYFQNFHILITWSERAAQNRHVLTILSEWCQIVMTYGHLMTEDLPYKPLYLRPGSLRLAPGSKYSNLIGTMSVFNCLYFGHYYSNGAETCQ